MDERKMHLINKIFGDNKIRIIWSKDEEKYYVSIVDVVGLLSESSDGRKYWNKLKQRLKEEGNELVTICHQLKLKSSDGKYYNTDVCDIDNMDSIELILTDLSEEATKRLAIKKEPKGLNENIVVARMGGKIAKVAKDELEESLGEPIISDVNKIFLENKR